MNFNNTTDSYCEQIVCIKKTPKTVLAIIGIWALALILTFLAFAFLITFIGGLVFLISAGIFYGAFVLSTKFNVEYEYIITNGWIDIDKITNKSSRKRIISFDLSRITRLEKYDSAALTGLDKNTLVYACDINAENVYYMSAERDSKGNANLIFSPNEKLQSAICKFAPRFITNNVFKQL